MFRTKREALPSFNNGIPEDTWEGKGVRRVRTPAGEKRYGQPIGSIIIGKGVGSKLKNLTLQESEYDGLDKVKTSKGKTFYIGKYDGDKKVTVNDPNDNMLYEASSLEDAFKWADANPTGKESRSTTKKPTSAKPATGTTKKTPAKPKTTTVKPAAANSGGEHERSSLGRAHTGLFKWSNRLAKTLAGQDDDTLMKRRDVSELMLREGDPQDYREYEHIIFLVDQELAKRKRKAAGKKGDMLDLSYKAVPISDVEDEGTGVVEAIVSVTGLKDNVNDIILPGAFQKSLAKRTPKGVWHHNIQESVAKTTEIKELAPGDPKLPETLPNGEPWPENAGGLLVKMVFNLGTSRGRDAYEDVKFFGTDQEWSIGYSVPTGGATIDKKTGTRLINSLDLFEYSPVLFGAMPNARTVSVKSAQEAHKVIIGLNTDEGLEIKSFLDEIIADEVKAAKKKDADDEEDDSAETDEEAPDETDDPDAEDADEEPVDDDEDEDEEVPTAKKKRGKKSLQIDAEGLDMLDYAVKSLAALYDHLVSEVKAAADDEAPEDSSEESLAGLVEAAGLDADSDAADFDEAYANGDTDGMETSGNAVLDAVESARDSEDADVAALKRVTSYIAAAFSNVEPSDEEPAEEKQFQTKKKFSKDQRDKDAAKGAAMPDGSFPIEDEADLKNAIKACGRAKDKEAAKKHIKKRAKALGLEDLIPADWDESKSEDVLHLDRKSLFAEFGIEV